MRRNFTVITTSAFVFIIVSLAALPVSGRVLAPQEALKRAHEFVPKTATKRIAALRVAKDTSPNYTFIDSATQAPLMYLYKQGRDADGWMLLSADDAAMPVLGYSDNGVFESDNASPAFMTLLKTYEEEISWARRRHIPVPDWPAGFGRPDRQAIAPLVTSRWNQQVPYNNFCPTVNGDTTVTGCVATAMAQIMYYHKWPVQPKNTALYWWNGQNLRLDYSTITFDWDNMIDRYVKSQYTTAQADAVALLMKGAGYGCHMEYGVSVSGAMTLANAQAYVDYMDYSQSLDLVRRNTYTLLEWENLIYDNLRNYGPVQICGYNKLADGSASGHSFVCDGLQMNALFHINWGWGGTSDGYFLFSALDPDTQGIGGSAAGYSINEEGVINIGRPLKDTTYYTHIDCMGGYIDASYSGSSITVNGRIGNGGRTDFYGTVTFESVNLDNDAVIYHGALDFRTNPWGAGNAYNSISGIKASSIPGNYRLKIYYKNTGQAERLPVRFNSLQAGYIDYTVGPDSTITSLNTPLRDNISVTGMEAKTPLYAGHKGEVTINVRSDATKVNYGYLTPVIYERLDESQAPVRPDSAIMATDTPLTNTFTGISALNALICDIYPGDNVYDLALDLPSSLSNSADYYVRFEQTLGQSVNGITMRVPISGMIPISVAANPGAHGEITGSFSILNPDNVHKSAIEISYSVTNSSGLFDQPLRFWVFPATGGTSITGAYSPTVYVGPGETREDTFTVAWEDGVPGTSYLGRVDYLGDNRWVSLAPSSAIYIVDNYDWHKRHGHAGGRFVSALRRRES